MTMDDSHGRDIEQDDPYPEPLDFETLRDRNAERCETSYHPIDAWSPTDWACALAGEVGEACNLIKKLRRITTSNPATVELVQGGLETGALISAVAAELADAVIYADLLADRLGIDLGEAVRRKFNETSRRIGSEVLL